MPSPPTTTDQPPCTKQRPSIDDDSMARVRSPILRKEDAIALVFLALQLRSAEMLPPPQLREFAERALLELGAHYRHERPIGEIAEDLVWLME